MDSSGVGGDDLRRTRSSGVPRIVPIVSLHRTSRPAASLSPAHSAASAEAIRTYTELDYGMSSEPEPEPEPGS